MIGPGSVPTHEPNSSAAIMPTLEIRAALLIALLSPVACSFALNRTELALIERAADTGNDASQVLLAVAYLNGDGGLSKNPAMAGYWFEQAAIQGNRYAQEKLGDLYEQGLGVDRNLPVAFDWRLKAAHRGALPAQVAVGRMYRAGRGVARNEEAARYWLERAATEGDFELSAPPERMRPEGNDARPGPADEPSGFEKAAGQGYRQTKRLLAAFEALGYAIEENGYRRSPNLEKLAEDGDREAQRQLTQHYRQRRDR